MARPKKTAEPAEAQKRVVKYDAETIAAIALKVKAEGFVPASELQKEFGADKTTQGIAVLYRDFRMFREVRRPWKDGKEILGYEWSDRRFSKTEQKKIPPELGFVVDLTQSMAVKYSEFVPVSVRCRYTGPILGAMPVKIDGDSRNVFDRDVANNVTILRYHQRSMASAGLPMIGKEQAAARRIGWSIIRLPVTNGNLTIVQRPVMDHGIGKGLLQVERLATEGVEFTIRAMVPTSVLTIAEFLQLLRYCGQYIGLSPGRSAGFGDFEVLGAE